MKKEHNEIRNFPLNRIDFNRLKDGIYTGGFEGGMYKWRENQMRVVVEAGKVTKIDIINSKEKISPEVSKTLFDRVLAAQSLRIDTISGATITSKAYLQGIENALIQAQD